jgi:hypothetical protein
MTIPLVEVLSILGLIGSLTGLVLTIMISRVTRRRYRRIRDAYDANRRTLAALMTAFEHAHQLVRLLPRCGVLVAAHTDDQGYEHYARCILPAGHDPLDHAAPLAELRQAGYTHPPF